MSVVDAQDAAQGEAGTVRPVRNRTRVCVEATCTSFSSHLGGRTRRNHVPVCENNLLTCRDQGRVSCGLPAGGHGGLLSRQRGRDLDAVTSGRLEPRRGDGRSPGLRPPVSARGARARAGGATPLPREERSQRRRRADHVVLRVATHEDNPPQAAEEDQGEVPRVYREIADADGDCDAGGVPQSARTLTGLQPVRITASFRSEEGGNEDAAGLFDDELHKGRILRTTRFEARRDDNATDAAVAVADDTFTRQHPWVDDRIRWHRV